MPRRSLIDGRVIYDNPAAIPSAYDNPDVGSGWDRSTPPARRAPTRAEQRRANKHAVERSMRREAARKAGLTLEELDVLERGS